MEDTEKDKPSDKENILYNIANADILENLETSIRPKKVRKRSSILKRKSQDAGSTGEVDRGESRRSLKRKVSFASTFQILEYRTETKIVASDHDPDTEMFSQPLPTPEQLLEPPPIPEKVSSEAKSASSCRTDSESTTVCSILKESVDNSESSLFLKDILNTDAFESSAKRARKDASGKSRNSSLNVYTSSQSLKETTLENTLRNQFGFHLNDTFAKVHVECSDSLDGEPSSIGPLENSNHDVPKQDTDGLLIDEHRGDDIFNASFLKSYDNEMDSSLAEDSGVSKPSPIPNETDFKTKQTYNATVHDVTNMSVSMLDEKDFSVATLPTGDHSFVVPKSRQSSIPTNKTVFCDDSMNMTCKIPLNKSSHAHPQAQESGSSLKMKSGNGMIESNKTAFFDNSMDLTCKISSRRISKISSGDLTADVSVVSEQDLSLPEGGTDFKQLNKTTLFDDSVDFTCKVTSGKVSALCSNSNDFVPDTSIVEKNLSAVTRENRDFLPSNKTALLDDSMDFTCKLTSTKISAPISKSHDFAADSSILMEKDSSVMAKRNANFVPSNKTALLDDSMDLTCKFTSSKSSEPFSKRHDLAPDLSIPLEKDSSIISKNNDDFVPSNKTALFDDSMDFTCKLTSSKFSALSAKKRDLMPTSPNPSIEKDSSMSKNNDEFVPSNKTALLDDSMDFTCKLTSSKFSALSSKKHDLMPTSPNPSIEKDSSMSKNNDFVPSNKTALLDDSMDFTCKLTSSKFSALSTMKRDLMATSPNPSIENHPPMSKNNDFVPSNKTALLDDSMDFTCKLPSSKFSALASKKHDLMPTSPNSSVEKDSSMAKSNDFVPSNKTALLDDSMDFTCKLTSSKFSALSSKEHHLMPASPNPSVEKNSSMMSRKNINLIQSNKTAWLDDSMDFTCKLPATKNSSKSDHAALSSSLMKHDMGSTLASKTLLFNDSMNFTGKLASTTCSSTSQVQFPSSGEDMMDHTHGSLNNSNCMPIVSEGLVGESKTSLLHLLNDSNMMSDNLCFQDVECDNGGNDVDDESIVSSTLVAPYPQSPKSEDVKRFNAQTSEFPIPDKTMLFEKSVEEINRFTVPVLLNEAGSNEPRSNVSSNTISVVENLDLTLSTSSNMQKHFGTLVNDDVLPDCISTGEEENQTRCDSISLETSAYLPRSEDPVMKKGKNTILSEKSMEETRVQTVHTLPKTSENFSTLSSKVYDATTFKIETMNLTIPNASRYQEDESLFEENRSDHKFDDSVDNIHMPIIMSISQILNEDDHIIDATLDASIHALPEMKRAAGEVLEYVEEGMTVEPRLSISCDESLNEKVVPKRKSSDASEYCSPPKIQHVCSPESPQSIPTSIEKPRNCPSVDLSDMPAIFTDKTALFSKDMEITCLNQNPCILRSSDLSFKDDCNASWMHESISLKPSNQSPDDVFHDKVKVPLYSVNGSPLCEKLALSNQADTASKDEMPSLICCDKTRRFSGEGMELTLLGNEHVMRGRPVKWLYGMTCDNETQPTLQKNGVACEQTVKEIDNTFRFNVVGMDFTCNVSTRLKLEASKILQESVAEKSNVLLNSSLDTDNLHQTPEISPSYSFHMTLAHDDTDEFKERCLPSAVEEKSILRPLSDTLHLEELSESNSNVQSPVIIKDSENQTPTPHLENTQSDEVDIDALLSRNASLLLNKSNVKTCKTFSGEANLSSSVFEALNKTKTALGSCANSPSTSVMNLSGFSERTNNSRKYSLNESRASVHYIDEACLPTACHEQSESVDGGTSKAEQQLEDNIFYDECENMEDQPLDRVDAAGDLVPENSNEVPKDNTDDDVHGGNQKASSTILGNIITAFLTESEPSPRSMKYIKNSIPDAKDLNPSEISSKIPDSASSENSKYQPLASQTAFQGPSSLIRRTKMMNIKEMLAEKRKMHQLRSDHLESAFLTHVQDDITEKGKVHQSPMDHPKSAPLIQDNVTESASDSTDTTVIAKAKPADTSIPLHTSSPDKISSRLENPTRKKPRTASQFDILFKIKDLKKGSSQIRNVGPSNCSILGGQILSVPLSAIGEKVQQECCVSEKILANETSAQPTECGTTKPQTMLKDSHQRTLLLAEEERHNEPVPSLNTTTAAENTRHNFSVPNIDMYTDYIKPSHAKSSKSDTINESLQIFSDSFLKEATFDISSFYSEKPMKPNQVVEETKTLGNFSAIVPIAHSTICEHSVFDSSLVTNKDNIVSNMTMVLEGPTSKETRKTYVVHTNAPTNPLVSESQQRENRTSDQVIPTDSVFQMGNEESKYESVFMEMSDIEEKANVDSGIPLSKVDKPNTMDNCTPIAEIDINTKDETLLKDRFNTDMDISEQIVAPLREDFRKTPKKCLDVEMSCDDKEKSFQTSLLKIATTSKFGMIDCPAKTLTVHIDRLSVIALTDHTSDDKKSCENAATVVFDNAEPQVDPSHYVDKSFLKHSPQNMSSEKLHADSPVKKHKDSSFGTPSSSPDLNESSYVVMLTGVDRIKSAHVDIIPSSTSKEETLISNDTAKNFLQEETPLTMQLMTTARLNEEHCKDQSLLREIDEVVDTELHDEHLLVKTKNNDCSQEDLKLMLAGSINFTNDILNQEEKVTLDLPRDVYKNNNGHETVNKIADVLTPNMTKANQRVVAEQDVELERCSNVISEEEPARNTNQVALEKTTIETLNLPRSDVKSIIMENLDTSSCQLNENEMSVEHGPIIVEQSENMNTSNKEELMQATCQSKWEKSGFSRTCLVEYSYSSADESSVMGRSHEDDVCREDIPLSMIEVNNEVEDTKVEMKASNIILDVDREKSFNAEKVTKNEPGHGKCNYDYMNKENVAETVETGVINKTVDSGMPVECFDGEVEGNSCSRLNGEVLITGNQENLSSNENFIEIGQEKSFIANEKVETIKENIEIAQIISNEKQLEVHDDVTIASIEISEQGNAISADIYSEKAEAGIRSEKEDNGVCNEMEVDICSENEEAEVPMECDDGHQFGLKRSDKYGVGTDVTQTPNNKHVCEKTDSEMLNDETNATTVEQQNIVKESKTIPVEHVSADIGKQNGLKEAQFSCSEFKPDSQPSLETHSDQPNKVPLTNEQINSLVHLEGTPIVAKQNLSTEELTMDIETPLSPMKVETFTRLTTSDVVLADVFNLRKRKKPLWTIEEVDETKVVFSYVWDSVITLIDTFWNLRMTVKFGDDVNLEIEGSTKLVRKLHSVSFNSVFNETVHDAIKLSSKVFNQQLGSDDLSSLYPDTSHLRKLLSRCSKAVYKAHEFTQDVEVTLKRHPISIQGNVLEVEVISTTLMSKFRLRIPIGDIYFYPHVKLIPVTVNHVYGRKINEKNIQGKVQEVATGGHYLYNVVMAVERMKP